MDKRLNRESFILVALLWTLICAAAFRILFFSSIQSTAFFNINLSNGMSKIIFYTLIIAGAAIGILAYINRLFLSAAFLIPLYPLAIYTVISRFDFFIKAGLMAAFIIFMVYAVISLIKGRSRMRSRFSLSFAFRNLLFKIRRFRYMTGFKKAIVLAGIVIFPSLLAELLF